MKEIGHNPWCNCFECEPNHVDALLSQKSTDPYIGKIWRAKNYAIKNYSQADINSRQFTGYKKGEVIGKFIGKKITPSATFYQTAAGFIVYDPKNWELANIKKSSTDLTPLQKLELGITTGAAGGLGGVTDETISNTPKVIQEATSNLLDFFGQFKWYIIGVIVLLVIAVFLRIKG